MSYPLVIRLMLAMTLMPDASYRESLARLAGVLADIPFVLQWHVPTEKVVTEWRLPVPADVMEDVFWVAAGPLVSDDEPSAVLLASMMVCAADGMLVNLPDTPENRAMSGDVPVGRTLSMARHTACYAFGGHRPERTTVDADSAICVTPGGDSRGPPFR